MIAVFGAGGAVGQHFVAQAVARGYAVRAFEPDWSDAPDLPSAIERETADVLSEDLAPKIRGCDVVASCIGLGLTMQNATNPPPLYTESARRYVDAMRETGIKRLVVISASFVSARDRGPLWFRYTATLALERIFTQMGEMERILRAAPDIDWTAVRPGWLMEGEMTGDYTVRPEVIPRGLIRTRHADVAHLMLDCIEEDSWIHGTPALARDEPAEKRSPRQLIRETMG